MDEKLSIEEILKNIRMLEKEALRFIEIEKALRESDRILFQIIQGSSIPTFIINDQHKITHWNRACENLTGLSASEMVGTSDQWRAFYAHKRPVMADLLVDNAQFETFIQFYEKKVRPSDLIPGAYEAEDFFPALGTEGKWLFFTAAPLKNASGKITGAIETLQDITERKRAEVALKESGNRYKRFIDFIPYPVGVFSLDGNVTYLNPAFTEVFGWTFEELEGKRIPYIPEHLKQETMAYIQILFQEQTVQRYETQRLTKDGRLLDVVLRAAIYPKTSNEPSGILLIHRDITEEKRIARNNETILRISMALPQYTELEDLLDYISNEIKQQLNTEGAVVILLDEEKNELFFLGAAYDDSSTQKKVKEIRFSLDQLKAGEVIRTGEPIIVQDASKDKPYPERDQKFGYRTRNFMEVPLRSGDRIFGVLGALNKKNGPFDPKEIELLDMISGTVALSIENARYSEELKKAYREVSIMNTVKDRMINHLSHELKTPMSILSGSLNVLENRLEKYPQKDWKQTIDRAKRNLNRLIEIQNEVDDIIRFKDYKAHNLISGLFEECVDVIEELIDEHIGNQEIINKIRQQIQDTFGPKEIDPVIIMLDEYVLRRLEILKPQFAHRRIMIECRLNPIRGIYLPEEIVRKVVDGIIRNAIENTPDEGLIRITVHGTDKQVVFSVHDFGVGIPPDAKNRILQGFYSTRDTMLYSTKKPFEFNAGGRGADLLRMKIFSERYHFQIQFSSIRCRYLPIETDVCPGKISECRHCSKPEDCYSSGETIFNVSFQST